MNNDIITNWFDKSINTRTKTFYLGSGGDDCDVNSKLAEQTIKALSVLDSIRPSEPLTIIMNNQGGEVYAGLAIYDAISYCQSEVIIRVMGSCMSMAAIILQAADKREMTENSTMMIHIGTDAHLENHPRNIERWVDEGKRLELLTNQILLNKIREVRPKFTKRQLAELTTWDKILSPKEALSYGLIDSII